MHSGEVYEAYIYIYHEAFLALLLKLSNIIKFYMLVRSGLHRKN